MPKPRTTFEPRTSFETGETVVELSFSVADLIKSQTKLESQLGKIDEKNDRQNEATRSQISDLRKEVRSDFASKQDLELVKSDVENTSKKADGTATNINKIALGVIGALITALIGFFFLFAQKGLGG